MRTGTRVAMCAVLLVGAAWPAAAQAPFEGVVTMRMGTRGPGAPAPGAPVPEIEYGISGGRIRMTMSGPGGGMTMLVMPADQKIYMLMPAQKAYMEMPMPEVTATAERASAATPGAVKVVRTGRYEMVAGYRCEHLTLTATTASGPQTTDACVSKALGAFTNPMTGMGSRPPAWQTSLETEGFPLKVTAADGTVALEVTKIEKKRMPNTLFAIPETYTRMAAPVRR